MKKVICGRCDEVVPALWFQKHHSDYHPEYLTWQIRTWPDGTQVIITDDDLESPDVQSG